MIFFVVSVEDLSVAFLSSLSELEPDSVNISLAWGFLSSIDSLSLKSNGVSESIDWSRLKA